MFYRGRNGGEVNSNEGAKNKRFHPFFWLFATLLTMFFLGSCIYLLIYSQTEPAVIRLLDDESELLTLVDQFARTITRQDWEGNTQLFVPGSTIDFHRAFQFLTDIPLASNNYELPVETLGLGSWGQQMSVFAGGLSSNHLLIGNCNITVIPGGSTPSANMDCISIYSYTLAYSMSLFTNNYPTQFVVFQPRFDALKTNQGWLFTHAVALINATSTLLSSIETGSAPPGAVVSKRQSGFPLIEKQRVEKRSVSTDWSTLLSQINILILGGQIDTAKAVCKTQQYQDLAAIFDPYGNDTAYQCNTIMSMPVVFDSPITCSASSGGINVSTCFPDGINNGIETINSITPLPSTLDYTITGGMGIIIQGNMHGLTIHNGGLSVINLNAPYPFYFTKIFNLMSPSITLYFNDTPANTVWAGPASGPDGQPDFRTLVLADIPLIPLGTQVTGILDLIHGGTNNGGPYVGERIIVSNSLGTQLIEAPLLPDGFFLVNDGGSLVPGTLVAGPGINVSFAGGLYTITNIEPLTVVQVDLSVPTDIFQVTSMPITDNGTLTFVTLPQEPHAVWIGPFSGMTPAVPFFRVLQEVDMPVISLSGTKLSGILPVSRGGTNNDGSTWVGERIIMSNTGGTSLTEATITTEGGISVVLGPGPTLLISGTGGTCTNDTIDQSCLDISTLSCPGGALGASCIPSAITANALTVTGPASLGTSTTCAAPLSAPCYDISSQSCPGGYLNLNCINPDLVLNSITVNTITANDIILLNGTVTVTGVSNFEIVNATTLYTTEIHLSGPMMCSPEDTISQDCYDISGISCTAPISSNCFPINITLADASVTNELEVNVVTCLGSPLGNDCIPSRVRTINGINPSAAPSLDFTISASTGILISPLLNGISIANTGVTSVGLSLPNDVFSVTIPTVTTTGVLTAVFQTQVANTFFAAPDGLSGVPSFRGIEFSDLPTTGMDSIYYVDGSGNLTTAPLSLSLVVPSSEFSISGSPITNPTGTFTIAKQNQLAKTLWMGPLSGGAAPPSFRTLALSDLSTLSLTNGQVLTGVTGGDPVGKTLVAGMNMVITEMAGSFLFEATSVDAISNISMTVPSYLTVTPATLTASGTFDITANNQNANRFLAGPTSGPAGPTTFRAMTYADLPPLADGQLYIGLTGGAPVASQLTAGSLITITPGMGTSTVSTTALGMVTLNMPSIFTVMSTSGVNSQTLTTTLNTQTQKTFFAGPVSGIPAVPTFRVLDAGDVSTGILPIARGGTNSGTALTNGKLMVSSGGTIVEGTSSSTPSFTSETLTATTNQLTLGTGNTATLSVLAPSGPRTYTIADPGANANVVMDTASALTITNAGVIGNVLKLSTATTATWQTDALGTVTSVGLALPSIFSVSGSPVTSSGTLTGTLVTQTANTFFAGPSSGGAATPTFRPLVTADLPVAILLSYEEATSATAITTFSNAAYTVVTSMTLTPVAGTYWCSFSTSIVPTTSSGVFNIALHLNGVIISHSIRTATGSSSYFNMHTLAVITTPGGQAIDVRWQKASGSGSANMFSRSLYCLRIA